MRISDWSSDVCSSDLDADDVRGKLARQHLCDAVVRRDAIADVARKPLVEEIDRQAQDVPKELGGPLQRQLQFQPAEIDLLQPCQQAAQDRRQAHADEQGHDPVDRKHTSELQSLMRISYAVFCLKKKKDKTT